MNSEKYILLTVDVEDWFQVENFRQWNPHSTWDSRELRVERNVHRLLDLFDSVALKNQTAQRLKLKGQVTDVRSQKAEDRVWNAECGMRKIEWGMGQGMWN